LVLAGLAFGAGMVISGSCISAHLYRLAEGSPTAPFALLGSMIGFGLGFMSWNFLYLNSLSDAPVIWMPQYLGYGGALGITLAIFGGLLIYLFQQQSRLGLGSAPERFRDVRPALTALFVDRWPTWIGGLIIGVIGTASYFRLAPIGVTAEIGSRARQVADAVRLLPERLEGLDTLRGCATIIRETILTPNGAFILGLVMAAAIASAGAGAFKPARPRMHNVIRGLVGGVFLGWGSLLGLGCTVGTLLSGVSAGAASGWVFGITTLLSVTLGLKIERWVSHRQTSSIR